MSTSFCHAGGTICTGATKVEVELDGPLALYELPAPPAEKLAVRAAVRASLRMIGLDPHLRLAPERLVVPRPDRSLPILLRRLAAAPDRLGRSVASSRAEASHPATATLASSHPDSPHD